MKFKLIFLVALLSYNAYALESLTPTNNSNIKNMVNAEDFINHDMQEVFAQFKKTSSIEAEKEIITKQVFPFMNWDEINKRVLGKYNRQFTESEKTEFNGLFKKLLLNSYVGLVNNYKNSTYSIGRKTDLEENKVKIRVQLNARENINMDYFLAKTKNGWRLFDVVVDGISFLEVYRSGFAENLSKRPPSDLIKQLHTKLDK